ncbi:MAG: DUF3298 domain-containing protein [Opitutales bacterium]|nr:DUF3298 domain-containing protein [Opitutales bacterium]
MKNSTKSVVISSLSILSASFFLNAEDVVSEAHDLAPFSEEIFVSGATLSPDVLGNISEARDFHAAHHFSFEFDVDYFKGVPAFNRAIFDAAFDCDEKICDPEVAIEKFISGKAIELDEAAEIADEYSFFVSAKAAPVVGNRVSVLVSRYEDTGGAHGNSIFFCLNFDLAGKKRIFLKDVFKEESIPALEKLLREHDPRREDAEFSYSPEKGEIPLPPRATENFLILPDEILFVYSPYELDCYAAGTILIHVPVAELRDLLK